MAELGYDLSGHHSKSLSEMPQDKYDYVITMGCGDECPFIPADHHEDWDIPDPKTLPLDEFRQVRDQIGERVKELAARIKGIIPCNQRKRFPLNLQPAAAGLQTR